MPQAPTLQITLSEEQLQFVKQQVESGNYLSDEAVLKQAVDILMEETDERQRWEQEILIPSIARLAADPDSAIPFDQVVATLETRRRERAATR